MSSSYQFHYREEGSPSLPPVLLLHGFTGCGDDWSETSKSMSDRFHCLLPDLPGHGKTTVAGPDEKFKMSNIAAGLIEWLDELSLEKCHLVAYSMGGRLGLYLAINFPNRFDKIVLESTSPGLKTEEERSARHTHDEKIANNLRTMPVDQFIAQWYEQPLFASLRSHPDKLQALLRNRSQAEMIGWSKSLQMMGTGKQPSLWSRLNEVKTDPLLIVGEKDAKFRDIGQEMAAAIPGAVLAVVTGAGHNVHLEQPAAFVEQVRQYLA